MVLVVSVIVMERKALSTMTTSAGATLTQENWVRSPTTVVTAYFQIRSKYGKEHYMEWMSTMLSLQDPMIIFTTEDWVQPMQSLRKHALDRTYFVTMKLQDVPLAKDYSKELWQHMLDIDPERKRHAGYEVFWIWLSKTYFGTEAIRLNPFQSSAFMWSDIGCFRGKRTEDRYKGQLMMAHPEVIPPSSMLFLSHKPNPSPPDSVWWTNKLKEKEHFYHSGTQMAGRIEAWQEFHSSFLEVMKGFIERDLFIGDDQTVLQCTCMQYPHLCAYITRNQVKDNHYFGLRYALWKGGKYEFWRPHNATV